MLSPEQMDTIFEQERNNDMYANKAFDSALVIALMKSKGFPDVVATCTRVGPILGAFLCISLGYLMGLAESAPGDTAVGQEATTPSQAVS